MNQKEINFLKDLQKMIAEKGTEWGEQGWYNYHRKYIVFIIEQQIEKQEELRKRLLAKAKVVEK